MIGNFFTTIGIWINIGFDKVVRAGRLHRPWRFNITLYVFVLLLTWVNNYFFYQSIEKSQLNRMIGLSKALNSVSTACMNSISDINICSGQVELLIKNNKDYYGHLVEINEIEIVENRKYEDRVPIYWTDKIPAINATIKITRNAVPIIWYSVFRSATFSIFQIMEKSNKIKEGEIESPRTKFINTTAIWRSAPHFSFLILMALVGRLMQRSIVVQIELVNELERLEDEELEKV
jgi:hypothetical protein